jgi:DNA-binding response OmpR family regulator
MTCRRLLIMDDDLDIAAFVAEVAAESGYKPAAISNTKDFATEYRRFDPDGVILDLAMPGQDGVQLLRFLCEEECRIPILLFSGFDPRVVDTVGRLGRELGLKIAGILRKPATIVDLKAALARAFPDTP